MKFFIPVILISVTIVPAVLALPFSAARSSSIAARELSAPSVILVTRGELEQILFERGTAASSIKESLGVELSDKDKKRLQDREDRKLREALEKHRLRTAEVASGGEHHHHAPEPTWRAGAPGQSQFKSAAEHEVKETWKKDPEMRAFTHAEILGSKLNDRGDRLHTRVRYHNNNGSQLSGVTMNLLHDPPK